VHILQVEQETDKDDITVLQHLLNCDVERTALLDELQELEEMPSTGQSEA